MFARQPRSTLFPYTTLFRSLHWPDRTGVPLEETWGAMAELVDTGLVRAIGDRKSTRLNSSHGSISYAVFRLKNKTARREQHRDRSSGQPAAHHPRRASTKLS